MSKPSIEVVPIPAFQDNYIWLISKPGVKQTAVVDPGDAQPVKEYLAKKQLELAAILITHHHGDHTGGIKDLTESFPQAVVYGPANEFVPGVRKKVREGDLITISALDLSLQVLDVAGHTAGHIAFFTDKTTLPMLFCGDTLFSVGCGRLLGGSALQLHNSLNKIAALPPETQIYCAHEYTLANIEFAQQVTPNNKALQERAAQVKRLRKQQLPSLPSSIELENASNPFLQTDKEDVITAAEKFSGRTLSDKVEVFTQLRKWKDGF